MTEFLKDKFSSRPSSKEYRAGWDRTFGEETHAIDCDMDEDCVCGASVPYRMSPEAVFPTRQGEGHLMGMAMVFVRFAGCSLACPQCDTDYSFDREMSLESIVEAVELHANPESWVWLTGGEPTEQDIEPLVRKLKERGYLVALATNGTSLTPKQMPLDWVSVSPHKAEGWVLKEGHELKLADGLNGAKIEVMAKAAQGSAFEHRLIQPLYDGETPVVSSMARVKTWLRQHPKWRFSLQYHKAKGWQ